MLRKNYTPKRMQLPHKEEKKAPDYFKYLYNSSLVIGIFISIIYFGFIIKSTPNINEISQIVNYVIMLAGTAMIIVFMFSLFMLLPAYLFSISFEDQNFQHIKNNRLVAILFLFPFLTCLPIIFGVIYEVNIVKNLGLFFLIYLVTNVFFGLVSLKCIQTNVLDTRNQELAKNTKLRNIIILSVLVLCNLFLVVFFERCYCFNDLLEFRSRIEWTITVIITVGAIFHFKLYKIEFNRQQGLLFVSSILYGLYATLVFIFMLIFFTNYYTPIDPWSSLGFYIVTCSVICITNIFVFNQHNLLLQKTITIKDFFSKNLIIYISIPVGAFLFLACISIIFVPPTSTSLIEKIFATSGLGNYSAILEFKEDYIKKTNPFILNEEHQIKNAFLVLSNIGKEYIIKEKYPLIIINNNIGKTKTDVGNRTKRTVISLCWDSYENIGKLDKRVDCSEKNFIIYDKKDIHESNVSKLYDSDQKGLRVHYGENNETILWYSIMCWDKNETKVKDDKSYEHIYDLSYISQNCEDTYISDISKIKKIPNAHNIYKINKDNVVNEIVGKTANTSSTKWLINPNYKLKNILSSDVLMFEKNHNEDLQCQVDGISPFVEAQLTPKTVKRTVIQEVKKDPCITQCCCNDNKSTEQVTSIKKIQNIEPIHQASEILLKAKNAAKEYAEQKLNIGVKYKIEVIDTNNSKQDKLCIIYLDNNTTYNKKIIEDGYAIAKQDSILSSEQEKAQKSKKGLWKWL